MVNRGKVDFGTDGCVEVIELLIVELFTIVHSDFRGDYGSANDVLLENNFVSCLML